MFSLYNSTVISAVTSSIFSKYLSARIFPCIRSEERRVGVVWGWGGGGGGGMGGGGGVGGGMRLKEGRGSVGWCGMVCGVLFGTFVSRGGEIGDDMGVLSWLCVLGCVGGGG